MSDEKQATFGFLDMLQRWRENRFPPSEWLKRARRSYNEFGGWATFRNGEWLWLTIARSFQNYYERATAEHLYKKYPNLDIDDVAKKLITVAAKNASILEE